MDKDSKEYFALCLKVYNKSLEWHAQKAKIGVINKWIDAQEHSETVRAIVKLRQANIKRFKNEAG